LLTHYSVTRTGDAIGKNFDYQFTYEHGAYAAYLANPFRLPVRQAPRRDRPRRPLH
jgi:hypothetical protein